MGALQRFVGGAAGAMANRYGQMAEAQYQDKMAEVRERRLSEMKLATEETLAGRAEEREQEKFDLTQTRQKESLMDPTSPTSLKRSQGMEDYEKKLQLQQQYKTPTGGAGAGVSKMSKMEVQEFPTGERDENGELKTDMAGSPLTRTYGRGPDGLWHPIERFMAEGATTTGGGGAGDPLIEAMERRRGGGQAAPVGQPGDPQQIQTWLQDLADVDRVLAENFKEGPEGLGYDLNQNQMRHLLNTLDQIGDVGERNQDLNLTRNSLRQQLGMATVEDTTVPTASDEVSSEDFTKLKTANYVRALEDYERLLKTPSKITSSMAKAGLAKLKDSPDLKYKNFRLSRVRSQLKNIAEGK